MFSEQDGVVAFDVMYGFGEMAGSERICATYNNTVRGSREIALSCKVHTRYVSIVQTPLLASPICEVNVRGRKIGKCVLAWRK
jgi:hypothetical protein